jgi:hypothetical protein
MSRKFLLFFALLCVSQSVPALASGDEAAPPKRAARKLDIRVAPWGPSQADIDAARARAHSSEAVQRELNGQNIREVGFEYVYKESERKGEASKVPTHFRVIYYNYATDRSLFVESNFAGTEPVTARWVDFIPGVGDAEITAAFRLIDGDVQYRGLRDSKKVEYYEAMPPTTIVNGERLVNIGILDPKTGANEIVGVSFKTGKVVKYSGNAPPTSAATPEACGIPNAGQSATGQGLAGQATITVNDGNGNPLWEMLVIRPSSSSGRSFERSGLEIRDVKYKGKLVLKRGHAPILNVKYDQGCGPFRDWQYSEGFFQAPEAGAQNPAPGIRVLADGQIATTAVESRNDTGNFQGVAIYRQNTEYGPEVVMVTEMNAGWYRYIMEWRFAADGTIRPRYGFASVVDSCVCLRRTHHVYWRLDFDVVGSTNKVFLMERGRRFQRLVETESEFFKRAQTSRSILIQNSNGDEAYQIVPGTNDGTVTNDQGALIDAFGAGDFWLMQFKGTAASPSELDDADGPQYPGAYISPWVNGESLVDQDVVVWYGAHQVRVDDASRPSAPQVITGSHIVGPVLRPVRW